MLPFSGEGGEVLAKTLHKSLPDASQTPNTKLKSEQVACQRCLLAAGTRSPEGAGIPLAGETMALGRGGQD